MNLTKHKNIMLCCMVLACIVVYLGRSSSLAAAADDPSSCNECHSSLLRGKVIHDPIEQGNCSACHEFSSEHLTEGKGSVATDHDVTVCYRCHASQKSGRIIHPGLETAGGCIKCHDPHGSDHEYILKSAQNVICFQCHAKVLEDSVRGVEHAAIKDEKSCMNCHKPHSSGIDSLLIKNPAPLCLDCHDREIIINEGGIPRTIQNIEKKVEEMEYVHNPAIWCISCHAPHGSQYRNLLVAAFPRENYIKYEPGGQNTRNTFELCFGCHKKTMLDENISAENTDFRNDTMINGKVVRQNLHWYHVVDAAGSDDKSRGRNCNICHDPHGSPNPHLLRTAWTMKNFTPSIVYETRPNGGECLISCHSPKRYQRIE